MPATRQAIFKFASIHGLARSSSGLEKNRRETLLQHNKLRVERQGSTWGSPQGKFFSLIRCCDGRYFRALLVRLESYADFELAATQPRRVDRGRKSLSAMLPVDGRDVLSGNRVVVSFRRSAQLNSPLTPTLSALTGRFCQSTLDKSQR